LVKRIGHKGAHHIEHGNTTASFDAALACGVDLIEFDVIRWRGQLVIAHDPDDAASRDVMTLAEGLDHLARPEFAKVGLDIDMKHKGFEREAVEAVHGRRLERRTMVTTMYSQSLARVRDMSDKMRCGLTIPFVSRDWLNASRPMQAVAVGGVMTHRLVQPGRVARELRSWRIDAVMAFHSIVTQRLVDTVHRLGGELYSWTVDDEQTIARLAGLGVDGIVSNDPRLFDLALGGAAA
jgi:glycerophosphoryl diester phosphodiesterase